MRARSLLFKVFPPLALALLPSPACDPGEESCRDKSGVICTIVGTQVAGLTEDGVPAEETELYLPQDVTIGPDHLLYIVDWNNHRIRVVRDDDKVYTVVGTGFLGDAPNGKAREINLNHPTHVNFTADGDFIISAWHNSKVLRYDRESDSVTAVCGTGARNFNGDGKAPLETFLDLPTATAFLPDGRLLIADQANQRVRVIEDDDTVATVVGTGAKGYSGDGGPATLAELRLPTSQSAPPAGRIAVDSKGVIVIADTLNHAVRKVDTDGIITTIAGTGTAGNGTSDKGRECQLNTPADVAIDDAGNVYIADTQNHCVRKVSPDGTIATVAGQCGMRGFKDGVAPQKALLDRPYGIELGSDGALWIADTHNHSIRVVRP